MVSGLWPYVYKVLMGVVIGLGILSTSSLPGSQSTENSMALPVAPPQSLAELVEHAPLILIGEVGAGQPVEMFGYRDGKPVTVDAFNSPLGGLPGTDFLLKVEKVIRDDGRIASGEPIVLRVPGAITEELKKLTQGTEYEVTYTGDRYLFLLSPYPDRQTYGFYYPWSRLIVDGDTLRLSDNTRQPLQFADNAKPITLDEFIQFVESRQSQ